MQRFRIYYGDGSTFTIPDDGPLEAAPRTDVQCIIWNDTDPAAVDDIGRHCLESWDYYIFSDRVAGFHGTNKTYDLLMHLVDEGCGPGGVRVVLIGKWIEREKFKRIRERARTDDTFRQLSARLLVEDGTEE